MKIRHVLVTIMAALAATLVGCAAPFNYTGADSPRALPDMVPIEPPPRIALVLSSGGPRGYAPLGVLHVLEEAGIEVDLVVGTSVGVLLGAFWADGRSAAELDAPSQDGGPLTVFDPSPFADRTRSWSLVRHRCLATSVTHGPPARAAREGNCRCFWRACSVPYWSTRSLYRKAAINLDSIYRVVDRLDFGG